MNQIQTFSDIEQLNNQFNVELMRIKTKPNTEDPIKANQLIELFESYINSLNAESNQINQFLINRRNNLSMNENKSQETLIIPNKSKQIQMKDI